MPEWPVSIHRVDFTDRRGLSDYLAQLDVYARDPMGGGRALSASVRERLARDLPEHPTAHCLLARHAGNAIGFATCFLGYSTFRAQPLLNLHDIAVLPQWRGRSVARRILVAVGKLAGELGCCAVTLEVREDNTPARALYEGAGFAPAACNLFMEKRL